MLETEKENEIYELLDEKCGEFFPDTGHWRSNCFRKLNDISPEFFPCHTRDDEWLSLMFQSKFKLSHLPSSIIKQYFQQSEIFQKARHDYEQKIVEWQIDWMNNDGEGWIVDENLGGDFFMFGSKCDIAFRKGIVDTLAAIGMHIDAIEEGIEKNSNKWREQYMQYAFRNIYSPISFGINSNSQNRIEVDPEFQAAWMKMRLYEYYQNHKDSVNKYGEVLPEMKMADEDVRYLNEYLDIKGQERLEQLKLVSNEEVPQEQESELNQKTPTDTTGTTEKGISKQLKRIFNFGKNDSEGGN